MLSISPPTAEEDEGGNEDAIDDNGVEPVSAAGKLGARTATPDKVVNVYGRSGGLPAPLGVDDWP